MLKRFLIVAWLLGPTNLQAQINPLAKKVNDDLDRTRIEVNRSTKVILPGQSLTNQSQETWFSMPRGSLEKLLVKAQGFDTLKLEIVPLIADTMVLRSENRLLYKAYEQERKNSERERWDRNLSLIVSASLAALVCILFAVK